MVDLDEEEYRKGLESLKFSVVVKIFLRRGQSLLTIMDLKTKLQEIWEIHGFKVVPMGSVHYHKTLVSME